MPKIYEYASADEILAISKYQKQFLKVASNIVKPDGIVVYSVCTTTFEECEAVVKFALENYGLTLERQELFFGEEGYKLYPSAELTQRFHPHKHDAGYFIARFRKTA
jgi:16S rRNA C967 or C1407 C5-methylase (RsmB/RsmF family)